jgi:hypothetical protein
VFAEFSPASAFVLAVIFIEELCITKERVLMLKSLAGWGQAFFGNGVNH